MRIVCLLGSPRRKGNSARVAERFLETAAGLGAETKTYLLNELTYKGCQACNACKTKAETCVVEDDLTEVLQAVREADVLVMASPVYFGQVSSQLKGFIDRTFSFLVPDFITNPQRSRLAPGKQAVTILCQGQPDEALFADIFPKMKFFLKWYGYEPNYLIRACGVREAGEIDERPEVMALLVPAVGMQPGIELLLERP